MGVEIERKFLVDGALWDKMFWQPPVKRSTQITQGYLSVDPVVRVRLSSTGPGDLRAKMGVKGPGDLEREEFEYPIPTNDAERMLLFCGSRVIHKIRFRVPVEGFDHLTWEVDRFMDPELTGLLVAEIELPTPNEVFSRPVWLGKEVTKDSRYANSSLAVHRQIPIL